MHHQAMFDGVVGIVRNDVYGGIWGCSASGFICLVFECVESFLPILETRKVLLEHILIASACIGTSFATDETTFYMRLLNSCQQRPKP